MSIAEWTFCCSSFCFYPPCVDATDGQTVRQTERVIVLNLKRTITVVQNGVLLRQ